MDVQLSWSSFHCLVGTETGATSPNASTLFLLLLSLCLWPMSLLFLLLQTVSGSLVSFQEGGESQPFSACGCARLASLTPPGRQSITTSRWARWHETVLVHSISSVYLSSMDRLMQTWTETKRTTLNLYISANFSCFNILYLYWFSKVPHLLSIRNVKKSTRRCSSMIRFIFPSVFCFILILNWSIELKKFCISLVNWAIM